MGLKSIQKFGDIGVVNYIGLQVWTLGLGGIYNRNKVGIFAWQW